MATGLWGTGSSPGTSSSELQRWSRKRMALSDWERKNGTSAGWSHIPTQKSGKLWLDKSLEHEVSRKAKVESVPGKDDRAGLIENSREHRETEISQCVLTWYHFATLELDTFLPEKAVRAATDWYKEYPSGRMSSQIQVSCIAGRFFTIWATRKPFQCGARSSGTQDSGFHAFSSSCCCRVGMTRGPVTRLFCLGHCWPVALRMDLSPHSLLSHPDTEPCLCIANPLRALMRQHHQSVFEALPFATWLLVIHLTSHHHVPWLPFKSNANAHPLTGRYKGGI